MNQFSRRKFLYTARISAINALLLKACGNPPKPGGETSIDRVETANISPEQILETTQVILGYIPIVAVAALVIARENAFFAKYGMTDLELSKQANWVLA